MSGRPHSPKRSVPLGLLALGVAASCGGRASLPERGDGQSAPAPASSAANVAPIVVDPPRAIPAPTPVATSAGQREPEGVSDDAAPEPETRCPPPPEPTNSGGPWSGALGAVYNVFLVNCGSCHGSEDAQPPLRDLGEAVARGLLDPCNPAESRLLTSMRDGSQPPPDSNGPRPSDQDIATIEDTLTRFVCEDSDTTRFASVCEVLPLYPGCSLFNADRALGESCGDCHGGLPFDEARVGTTAINDVGGLIDGGYLVPCNAGASPLFTPLRTSPSPAHELDECARPSRDEALQTVEEFVDGLCGAEIKGGNVAARDAAPVLAERCGGCHSAEAPTGMRPAGETWDVRDLQSLTRDGLIQPCLPGQSPIVARMRDGSMPPASADAGAPIGTEEIAVVERFAESFCDRP